MRNKGDWMLLIAAIVGGGGFIGVKYLLDWGYTPYQVIFWRFFVAMACLSLVYRKRYPKISKKEWKMGSFLGLLLSVTFFLVTLGLQYTTPSISGFLGNATAVIVPFVCWIAFRQKPAFHCFLAAGLTVLGVALLSITASFHLDIGAVLSFGASIAFSIQMAFMSKVVQDCDGVHIALVEHIAVVVVAGLFIMVSGVAMPSLTMAAVGSFFYVGALCTGLYFVLQSVGQKYTSANKAAIIITSEAVFAAILSAIFYGERMGWRGYLGCGVVFLGMLLAEKPVLEKSVDSISKIG